MICMASLSFVVAQDIVVLKTGEEVKTKVKKVGVTIIEYVRYDNQGGPVYEVLKDDIFKIKYANGVEDVFAVSAIDPILGKPVEGTFIDDRDNKIYRWVKIGEQTWMGENLTYDDGVSPCPQSKNNECDDCGRYYRVLEATFLCPDGWHLPSDQDWMELEITAGMNEAEATKTGWRGTRPGQGPALLRGGKTGLNLRMCGYVVQTNQSVKKPKYSHKDLKEGAYYWTSTDSWTYPSTQAIIRHIRSRASIERIDEFKNKRFPVRCVKDIE